VPDILIALVGNKSDLIEEAQVNTEEIYDYAKEIKAEICKETSAKDNLGINDLFLEIA
jgi:GTPase SAR1 family protein